MECRREERELLDNIKEAKRQLEIANKNFDFVKDESLIDYYTYQIKACETRYQYLLKLLKKKNITAQNLENVRVWSKVSNLQ